MNAEVADLTELETGPRHTADLIGHPEIEHELLQAHASGRLPHAWLLTGPAGIGKATMAFRFARYLFAHPPGTESAAGGLFDDDDIPAETPTTMFVDPDRPVFHRVASGGHSDLFTLERTLNDKGKLSQQIRVGDVRDAIHFAHMTPSEGGYKVIIVDGAEAMNRESENALLKVLEEPPADTVIIMVSHAPGRLLPTTRSRCRAVAMKPLANDDVVTLLARHAPELSIDEAAELARLSGGSIGRAMMLAAGEGLETYRDMLDIFTSLQSLDGRRVQELAKRLGRTGADDAYRSGIELFRWWLSRIVLAASRGAEADSTLNEAEKGVATRAASTAILPVWLGRLDESESLIRSADTYNFDRRQVILSLFLAMA